MTHSELETEMIDLLSMKRLIARAMEISEDTPTQTLAVEASAYIAVHKTMDKASTAVRQ
jgi:hypothetical protein